MSYLAPSHRLFDSPDLSPFPPIHNNTNNTNTPSRMLNLSSYDPLPLPQHPSSLAPDQSFNKFPKVGETRCYWTLLSADLHFLYLDPVLAHHLVDQANDLVGKSLFDFVHPDEKASATHDLRNVLESRTLHGSVTRMRYSRLSRVRRLLGYQGPHHVWPEAEKIAIDSNYMAVDLVINWAAEGLVLCFIHAVVDLTPYDNDEHVKTGWTNWCGTSAMNDQEAQLLYQRLLHSIPQSGNMSRAFQILLNQPDRPLLFSWPPQQAQGPTASDFAKLSDEVQIENSPHTGNDAKTSCTRRYKALQNMTSSDGVREVESIFIPHGSIIFACHKVNSPSRSSSTSNASMQQQQSNYDTGYMGSQSQQFYSDQTTGSYALPPMQVSPTSSYSFLSQSSQVPALPPFSAQPWSTGPDPSTSHQLLGSQWASAASPASYTSGTPQMRVSPYASQQQQQQQQQTPAPLQRQWSPQPSPYAEMDNPMPQASYSRPLSPSYGYSSSEVQQAPPPNPDTVPPPKTGQRRTSPSNSRDQYGSGGRSSGHPPVGITRCSSCKVTQSPEWRKGPSGKKDLCNACGLRYARSRAKKEGIAQRRRKDKAMGPTPKQEQQSPKPLSATPPLSAPYPGLRQASYEDTSFTSTSPAGSGSGSEAYPPPGPPNPQAFNSLTPSPSPPAGNIGFQHYPSHRHARESDVRQQYPSSTPSYYPSPLSNTGVQHGSHGNGGHGHTLSRIESLPQLVNRMSPLLSSASSSSPGSGHAASYERERDRDRDSITLPPTPLSADPRHGPASKMTFVTQ